MTPKLSLLHAAHVFTGGDSKPGLSNDSPTRYPVYTLTSIYGNKFTR